MNETYDPLAREYTPPAARKYIEFLNGRVGVVGVWVAHGKLCMQGHAVCTSYVAVIDRAHAEGIVSGMASIYATNPELRVGPMCWDVAMADAFNIGKFPREWERIVFARDSQTAEVAGVTTHSTTICVHCRRILNGCLPDQPGTRPKPGYYTLCAGCGGIYRFTEGLVLEPMTAARLDELEPKVRSDILQYQARFRAKLPPIG